MASQEWLARECEDWWKGILDTLEIYLTSLGTYLDRMGIAQPSRMPDIYLACFPALSLTTGCTVRVLRDINIKSIETAFVVSGVR